MGDADNPQPTRSWSNRTITLSYIHILIILAVQLGSLALGYGELKQTVEDMHQDSKNYVPRGEFDTWRDDVRDSLHRIEAEIVERNRMERELK